VAVGVSQLVTAKWGKQGKGKTATTTSVTASGYVWAGVMTGVGLTLQ